MAAAHRSSLEKLPDLDPEDRRRELEAVEAQRRSSVVALALGLARGVIEEKLNPQTGMRAYKLKVRDDRALDLAEGLLGAADALIGLRKEMPAVYDSWVAPLLADVAVLDEELVGELRQLARSWATRAQDLELDGKTRSAEYRELAAARSLLGGVVGES